jgi:membrane protein required for colicin V production
MTFIDIVLGGLLCFGLFKGIRNGFIVELASLISYMIGIYLAVKFSYILTDFLGNDSKVIPVIGFILTFILVVIGVRLLAKIVTKVANFAFLGLFNSLLGAVLGVLRMTLFLGVALTVLGKITPDSFIAKTKKESYCYTPILACSSFIVPILEQKLIEVKKR